MHVIIQGLRYSEKHLGTKVQQRTASKRKPILFPRKKNLMEVLEFRHSYHGSQTDNLRRWECF